MRKYKILKDAKNFNISTSMIPGVYIRHNTNLAAGKFGPITHCPYLLCHQFLQFRSVANSGIVQTLNRNHNAFLFLLYLILRLEVFYSPFFDIHRKKQEEITK